MATLHGNSLLQARAMAALHHIASQQAPAAGHLALAGTSLGHPAGGRTNEHLLWSTLPIRHFVIGHLACSASFWPSWHFPYFILPTSHAAACICTRALCWQSTLLLQRSTCRADTLPAARPSCCGRHLLWGHAAERTVRRHGCDELHWQALRARSPSHRTGRHIVCSRTP